MRIVNDDFVISSENGNLMMKYESFNTFKSESFIDDR